jgi:uncharacterized membrane protein YbhN (UPF0104 family)
MSEGDAPRLGWPALVLGIAVLIGVIVVAGRLGEAGAFLDLVKHAHPGWLLLAVAMQALTYATEATVWHRALAHAGKPLAFTRLYTLSLRALLTNQLVPTAGVAGIFLVVRGLERDDVPHPVALGAVLLDLVGFYVAYGAFVGLALVLLRQHHDLPAALLGMAGALVLLGVALSAGAMWLAAPDRKPPAFVARIRPLARAVDAITGADPSIVRNPALVATAGALRLGNFLLDAFTLWACLRALGQPAAAVDAAIAAFAAGSLARTLGIVPGGLGTFEAATVAGLRVFGIGIESALTATLLFRGLSFWLPMLPAAVLGRGHREGA